MTDGGKPSEFLKGVIGKRVKVRLSDGTDYFGRLLCLDGFMNVALEDAEEQSNRKYGTSFIRGNNVLYITPA